MVIGNHRHTKRCDKYSERKKTKCPNSITSHISATALFFIRLRANEKRTHNTVHRIIHKIIIHMNCQIHVKMLSRLHHHCNIIAIVTKKSAIAVQSLKRLSHSKRRRSLLGTHRFLNNERTATGSVADMIIHNKKLISNGTWYHISHVRNHTHNHMSKEHSNIQSVASHRIGK